MEMSERILAVRKKAGLNQADFGKRIGVTRSAVCNYESGSRSVGEQVILAICREFNISEEWLRTDRGGMSVPTPENSLDRLVQEFKLDSLDREIISEFVKLDDKAREAVKLYIKRVSQHLYLDAHPAPAAISKTETTTPAPDTAGQERTGLDLAAELAELKRQNQEMIRQNQELAAEIAAMKEEERDEELAADFREAFSALQSGLAGNSDPAKRAKK